MGDALFRREGVGVYFIYGVEGSHHVNPHRVNGSLDQKLSHRLTGLLQRRDASVLESLF